MGLFLGASLVSIFEMMMAGALHTTRRFSKD